jgi:hypothetical protein
VFRETVTLLETKSHMPRKRWTAQTEVTPSLLKFREKRKWQIALRRYLLEKNPCVSYAPYFGLDIESFRKWIEMQFTNDLTWESFGKNWQFEHIIPVTYFDFADDDELMLCWNFTNIRVETIQNNKDRGNRVDVLMAKDYFGNLYTETGYEVCQELLRKIERIEIAEMIPTTIQKAFILQHKDYLKHIEGFTSYEFELLNSGRDIKEVKKEAELIKKLGK